MHPGQPVEIKSIPSPSPLSVVSIVSQPPAQFASTSTWQIKIVQRFPKDIQGIGATLEEGSWISTSYLVAEIMVIPDWMAGAGIFYALVSSRQCRPVHLLSFHVLCGRGISLR